MSNIMLVKLGSLSVLACSLSILLVACAAAPDAVAPKVEAGPLAGCCEVVPGRLSNAEAGLLAAVVRTPEQEAELFTRIGGLKAAKDACAAELAAPNRDDAAALARVKKAAGSFDLALNVPECK